MALNTQPICTLEMPSSSVMNGAAMDLGQTSKDLPHILPFPTMMDVFGELAAKYEEEHEEEEAKASRRGEEMNLEGILHEFALGPLGPTRKFK